MRLCVRQEAPSVQCHCCQSLEQPQGGAALRSRRSAAQRPPGGAMCCGAADRGRYGDGCVVSAPPSTRRTTARGRRAAEAPTCCPMTARGRSRGSGAQGDGSAQGAVGSSAPPDRSRALRGSAAASRGAELGGRGGGNALQRARCQHGPFLAGRAAVLGQEPSEPFVSLLSVRRGFRAPAGEGQGPVGSRGPPARASAPCVRRLSLRLPGQGNKGGASAGDEGAPGRERGPAGEKPPSGAALGPPHRSRAAAAAALGKPGERRPDYRGLASPRLVPGPRIMGGGRAAGGRAEGRVDAESGWTGAGEADRGRQSGR